MLLPIDLVEVIMLATIVMVAVIMWRVVTAPRNISRLAAAPWP